EAGDRRRMNDVRFEVRVAIPLRPDFRAFVKAVEQLAKLHLDYEKLKPWELESVEAPGVPLSYARRAFFGNGRPLIPDVAFFVFDLVAIEESAEFVLV